MNKHIVAVLIAVGLTASSFIGAQVQAHELGGVEKDLQEHQSIGEHCMDKDFTTRLIAFMVDGGMEMEDAVIQVGVACFLNQQAMGDHDFEVYHPANSI